MLVALLTFCSVSAIFAAARWGSVAVLLTGLGSAFVAGAVGSASIDVPHGAVSSWWVGGAIGGTVLLGTGGGVTIRLLWKWLSRANFK